MGGLRLRSFPDVRDDDVEDDVEDDDEVDFEGFLPFLFLDLFEAGDGKPGKEREDSEVVKSPPFEGES